MAGYSRARSAAAFCLSLAVHAAIFGGSWYIYKTGRAEPVIVENVLGWESLEYLTEEEHAPAPPPAPEPPPPPPPEPEPEPESEPEPVVEEKAAPVEIKKEPPPPPKKEKSKPKKEKPKEKPKPKEQPKPEPRREEPEPQIRERPPITPPPRPVNIAPPATNHYGQIPNANAANNGRANGGTRDGAQSGAKITEKNYNAGLQGRIASTVQKRKGRIRERGTAVVAFDIQASGQFTNIRIEQSSGVQRIDDLILESVRSVGSYAPPPEGRTVAKRIPLNVR